MKFLNFLLCGLFILNLSSCVEGKNDNSFKVIPVQHATMVIEWNGKVIYVDPVGGAVSFQKYKRPDIILVTDIHGDHFNLETVEGLYTEKVTVVVPQAVADKMPESLASQIEVLKNNQVKDFQGLTIEGIPMYNLREEALKFHTKGRGNGYVLEMQGERVYISGDTEDIPEMRSLKNIDRAFICMNLPYTMPVENAADAVLAFQPKIVYPYHYRGTDGFSDIEKFKSIVNQKNENIDVTVLNWYW